MRIALFHILICAIFLCACTRNTPASNGVESKTLLIGNSADPSSLDPSLISGLPEFKILCALFEGLLSADSKTLEPIPAAAKSWKKEGLRYTFNIRENAVWSDGQKLKASDFVFAFKRILNPALAAEYSNFLDSIKNAKAIREGKMPQDKLGAYALDDSTLVIELEYDCPHFLNLLSHTSFFPLPEHILKKFDAVASRNAIWMRPENAVSNGAFVLTEYKINEKIRVEKSKTYWDKENVKLNAIEFLPISNIYTEDRAFRAGQIHITDSIAPTRLDAIRKNSPQFLRIADFLGVYYYSFNTSRPPLDNPDVRQALSIAIPRESIIKNFLNGGQKPAYSFVPPSVSKTYSPNSEVPRDLKLAKKLLAQAGYPNGKNFPKIKITYNTSELHRPIAEAIQASWKEHLGIEVELYNLSWPAYNSARKSRDFDITRSSWIADYLSPETFLTLFLSNSYNNYYSFKSTSFDSLIEKAKTSSKEDAQNLFKKAEEELISKAVIAPIYFYTRVHLVDTRVKNWDENPLDYRNYKAIDLQESEDIK